LIVIPVIHVIHSPQQFFWLQQNSFKPSSDNRAFEDSSPKTMCSAFYQKKVSSLKQADLTNMFKKASKSVHISTIVVSPDPLSPTLTSSPMKKPWNIEEDTNTLNQQMKDTSKWNTPMI